MLRIFCCFSKHHVVVHLRSQEPSSAPTYAPSEQPSVMPSFEPTSIPSLMPTNFPSKTPTSVPSNIPSSQPTQRPTPLPTLKPSQHPSDQPTQVRFHMNVVFSSVFFFFFCSSINIRSLRNKYYIIFICRFHLWRHPMSPR